MACMSLTIKISLWFGISMLLTRHVSGVTTREPSNMDEIISSTENHLVQSSQTSLTQVSTEIQPTTLSYSTNTTFATNPFKIDDHPVEDAFFAFRPILHPIEYYDDTDTFIIRDGKLVRVPSDISVYGNSKFVLASWKIIGPILLVVLLLSTSAFCSLIIYRNNKDSKMNKCSTMLLVCIGLFDILTIASAMAENIYLYNKTKDNYGALPFESCHTMYILERLSPVPHTISLWLTLVLSLQRFVCVSKPFAAKTAITLGKTLLSIIFVIVLAVGFHIPRYFDLDFKFVALTSAVYPDEVIGTCDIFYKPWINNSKLYEAVYLWTRFVIVKLVPCLSVMILSFVIFRNLRKNIEGRHGNSKSKANSSSNRLSLYIAIVSLIIVVAELPIGVISCIYAVSISLSTSVILFATLRRVSFIADIVLYISYCMVFLIYCIMTKKVRGYISTCVSRVTKRTSKECTSDFKVKDNVFVIEHVSTDAKTTKIANEVPFQQNRSK